MKDKKKSRKRPANVFLALDFFVWMKLLQRHRFQLGLRRIPLGIAITFVTMAGTLARWLEQAIYGRRVSKTEIKEPPVFIIGHWRSGTTLLHELLGMDSRHVCPTTYECFFSNHFLLTERFLKPLLNCLVPARRVQDNMAMDLDLPQEDEIALGFLGAPSPYMNMAFPNRLREYEDCYDLEQLAPQEVQRWKRIFLSFLKRITYARSGRLIIKSPTHTFRIKVLLSMFPDARFVHIVRDPYRVFQSTMHMWRSVFLAYGLQTPDFAGLEDSVFETFNRMYEKLGETKGLIAPAHFYELRYEELVKDPVDQMRRLYGHLSLGDFEANLLPELNSYLAKTALYKTNQYDMTPELRDKIAGRCKKVIKRYNYPALEERAREQA